jgi:hypothetical protein
MPYTITKFDDSYKVTSPHGTKAKKTTKTKAKKQVRLLQAIEHNPNFTPYSTSNTKDSGFRRRRR